jgi:hypothetical protein
MRVSQFPFLGVKTWKLFDTSRNLDGSYMKTISLKDSANKVLYGNTRGNIQETQIKNMETLWEMSMVTGKLFEHLFTNWQSSGGEWLFSEADLIEYKLQKTGICYL